jgi:hypothetical protein
MNTNGEGEREKNACVAVKRGVRIRIRDQNPFPPLFLKKVFVYGKGVQNASLLIVIIIK